MPDARPFSYDEVPYPGGAFDQTHPDRLATLATLFGLSPPPVPTCRVLELGCGNGGNIVPMALDLPGASFLGIDLSARHIETGARWATQLGLRNLKLVHGDILELDPAPNSYDYIVAHGVFSWVPPEVREKVLAICRTALAPNGVAYISYNTYPGGHTRAILRDAMLFHTRNVQDPARLIGQARAAAKFVTDGIPAHNPLYASLIKGEWGRLSKLSDGYLRHDNLSENNTPFYFHEFVARAAQHGFMYLAEALFGEMRDEKYPEPARQMLRQIEDIVTYEQYLDFLSCRAFRQTLLVRDDLAIDRRLDPSSLRRFLIRSDAFPIAAASTSAAPIRIEPSAITSHEIAGPGGLKFATPRGVSLTLGDRLAKGALVHLARIAPHAAPFDALLDAARSLAGLQGAATPEDAAELGQFLLAAYAGSAVSLHVHEGRFTTEISERPTASPLARLQIVEGPGVTSLIDENIELDDPFARALLPLLDGTRDRAALIAALSTHATTSTQALAEERLDPALHKMARYALLLS